LVGDLRVVREVGHDDLFDLPLADSERTAGRHEDLVDRIAFDCLTEHFAANETSRPRE
jgi:hypothetical protein